MKKDFVLAVFDDEETLVKGAQKAQNKNIKIHDIYTPFPVHGLDEAMGIKRSFLPYVTFGAALTGLTCALSLQIWTSAIDWPTNIGGKPFISLPAFVPVSFELTVLFGAHITVLAFLISNKLYPGKKAVIVHPEQTDDKFIMAVEKSQVDVNEFTNMVKSEGAIEVRVTNVELE